MSTNLKAMQQYLGAALFFFSKKFSSAALRWDIHKKEAYAIFIAVSTFQFLLTKKFVIETDHTNLLYMEQNVNEINDRDYYYENYFENYENTNYENIDNENDKWRANVFPRKN